MAQAKKLTTREVADIVGTDPRTLRRYLRAEHPRDTVGKGKRYAFTEKQAEKLAASFAEWATEPATDEAGAK